ncbi:Transposon-encoded protein TnpW [Sarcina sp. DSM 11001]|nr:Transposon-encoded protein TnpW [Sarcina sp. DSM 11001]
MAETKTKNMNHRKDIMCNTAGSLKEEQLVEVPSEAVLVRKRIGKQTFLVRVHFKEDGAENLQAKICRMLCNEVRNSGNA